MTKTTKSNLTKPQGYYGMLSTTRTNHYYRHLTAERKGSWGVGQDYYRIKTVSGRIFDIYYDRSPKSSDKRKGQWFVYRELRFEG